jgi:DNA processing protein
MQLALSMQAPLPPRAKRAAPIVPGWGEVHVAGDTALLAHPGVAIIGSRRSTPEGQGAAASIAGELARAGVVVLSGLAAGIDRIAHEATMAAGGRTIAVIGTSLDRAYPKDHAALQARIADEHLVVSPFEAGTPMSAWHFPKRNRLMAQLAQVTILIEASATSGTRHQVSACAALGRPVLAPAHLVEQLGWLQSPNVRRHVLGWHTPEEAVQRVLNALHIERTALPS